MWKNIYIGAKEFLAPATSSEGRRVSFPQTPSSMASFPFRPPQFSDDLAWLPPWIQSNQIATPLNESSDDLLHQSLQNMEPFKGDNNPVKDPNILSGTESRNHCHLYLSGEDSQVIFTPSCEKLLHFNLHLSSDGFSSIISSPPLEISGYEKVEYENVKQVQPSEPLHGSKEAHQSNVDCNVSFVENFPSSNEGPGDVHNQTQSNSSKSRDEIPEIFESNGTENDDINAAVELSVAASEALVIYEQVQSGSISEGFCAAAVLEIALRVKHARLEGLQDTLCCSNEDGNTTDILSELCDSDMEEAYEDVGLSLSNSDTVLKDSSISRVKDTPMSEVHPGQEREVQSEMYIDQEAYLNNSFAEKFLENNLGTSKLKDMPTENVDSGRLEKLSWNLRLDLITGTAYQSQPGSSDDLQIMQGDYKSIANSDGLSQQIEATSFSRVMMSAKANELKPTMWNSCCLGMGKLNDNSSCRFQSRWFGGWTRKEVDVCAGAEFKATKTTSKPFNWETSYLSESADVAPDQNSFVHNHPHCSKPSESVVPLEDSSGRANVGAISEQDAVNDSNLSFIDPLCSVVPCSISAEIESSSPATNNNDNFRMPASVKSRTPQLNNQLEDVQITSQEHIQRSVKSISPNPIIRRELTSLRPYSVGLPENSTSSINRSFNCGRLRPGECNVRLLSGNHETTFASVPYDKDTVSPIPVRSICHCTAARSNEENYEARILSKPHHVRSANTSDGKADKMLPAFSSMFSFDTTRNNEETHEIIGHGNAFDRSIQDDINRNAEKEAEVHVHLKDLPASPLVLCRRTRRRFKAPKLPVIDSSTANQVHGQAPASDMILHKSRENPQSQHENSDSNLPARKRVCFSEIDTKINPKKSLKRMPHNHGIRSSCRVKKKPQYFDEVQGSASQEVKERLTKCHTKGRKRTIFQGLEFLLTGFSKKKEKELEGLLQKHGGLVLSDIPVPPAYPRGRRSSRSVAQRLPVILCTKKLQTTKFLYGCAVNAFLLKVGWAYDSIKAGSVLPPDKYVILSNQTNRKLNQIGKSVRQNNDDYIFDKVGIMLHGRHSFCSKLVKFIKHGGGRVYKSLQWLVQGLASNKISVGAIVAEDENHATRHLKKCASEQKIPVLQGSWIIKSLFEGQLLPFEEGYQTSHLLTTEVPDSYVAQKWSREI